MEDQLQSTYVAKKYTKELGFDMTRSRYVAMVVYCSKRTRRI
jgi:hypothetical protein